MTDTARVLHEPWPSVSRQREGVAFGVWVFIASEILFFSGLFVTYTIYRTLYPDAFKIASRETDVFYGTLNTAILLTSSLTMALSVALSEKGFRRITVGTLSLTALLGLAFMTVKGFEYAGDLEKGLWPSPNFPLHPAATQLFWTLYWIMTGIHAIHLSVGIGIVITITVLLARRDIPPKATTFEGVALYWH
ncbi:MAG: cytochrome c oxidase subunit 3, partial [Steroidobacteraceae bacterium]